MKFVDAAPIAGTRRTADGYLVADVRTARTGLQTYAGWEVGKPDMPIVRVYRAEDQVFSKDSLGSYAHKPVTNDHPDIEVTAETWKDYAVGQIGDEIARDGEFVRVPLIVMDAAAIKAIEDGKRELSAGYSCDLSFEAGKTSDGQAYDAVQRSIKINHVAIVDRGRAGSQARIGDGAADGGRDRAAWGASPLIIDRKDETMADAVKTRTVLIDGLSVETTDAGAQALEKLTKDKEALAAKLSDAEKAYTEAMAAKDAELAKKDAEIDDLKSKVLDAAALDKRVQARGDLIATAKTIAADVKTDGLSDADIRKAVVVAKLGDDAVKDKADAYIDARFDFLAEDAAKNADPLRYAGKGGTKSAANDAWGDAVFASAGVQMKKGA